MALNLVIIFGSVRSDRQGIKAARFVQRQLVERGHTVTLVDPLEYQLPLLDRMYKEYDKGTAPEQLERLATLYRAADGFVIVTAEYNHGAPPALVNLLDHFLEEYFFRPSAIVSYSGGSFGGVRAASHLRDMLAELGMAAIPSSFPVPKVGTAFDEAGVPADAAYVRRFTRFASELEWYAQALKTARQAGVPY
jgi:NAD(P)H-dependent FMN reductase